jgi:nitrite reductase/ring-hydroxylating ferredoxin subunit
MKRAPGLLEFSRREFCAAAGGCLGLALVGCTDGDTGAVQTGPLGSSNGSGSGTDAPDAGHPPGDAAVGVACTGTAADVGAAASYALNSPKYFASGKYFVVRDAGGFYAITAICTHEGATNGVSGGNFRCPRHGALFTLNGTVISGPVFNGLVHYAMCNLPNGNLGVMLGTTVAQSARLVG